MSKLTKLGVFGLFLLFLSPLVNAVTIESGTLIQSVGLNLTFNFTSTKTTDSFIVSNISIYFDNYNSNTGDEYINFTYNFTETNKYYGNAIPISFTSSSSTQKVINSSLVDAINSTLVLGSIDFAHNPVKINVTNGTTTLNYSGGWSQLSDSTLSLDTTVFSGQTNVTILYALGGGTGGTGSGSCTPNWSCSDYGVCNSNNQQYRTCSDLNSCNDLTGKPLEQRTCIFIPNNIVDKIKDAGQTIINTITNPDKTKVTEYVLWGIGILAFILLIVSTSNKNNAQADFFNRRR